MHTFHSKSSRILRYRGVDCATDCACTEVDQQLMNVIKQKSTTAATLNQSIKHCVGW